MSLLEIEAIFSKLKSMVRKRYGCEIEWRTSGEYSLSGDEKLNPADRLRLNQLIRLVLEAAEVSREQISLLAKIEESLNRIQPSQMETSNIFNLEDARRKKLDIAHPAYVYPEGRNFRAPCLIESRSITEIHKLALEIHDHSNSLIFQQVEDVNFDFNNLHRVTLFIPDICALNSGQQLKLHKIMLSPDLKNGAHIIGGTVLPYAQLKTLDHLHKEFLYRLSSIYIRMTKPFNEYKRLDVLPYIFDSLVF